MNKFAFILHPIRISDITRRFPIFKALPASLTQGIFKQVPPFKTAHITGIKSITGQEAEGWFIVVPWSPEMLLNTRWPIVLDKILKAGHIAEELGVDIMGLGAFLKVVGDKGVSVAKGLSVPVTTGNSYTTASAVQGALLGAERLGIDPKNAHATVVGATGAIGAACARVLCPKVGHLTLCARSMGPLEALQQELRLLNGAEVGIVTDSHEAIKQAEIVITVTSATDTLIEPEDIRPGAVVCDVARPRNVSQAVYERRRDVLVIDGGVIKVPGENVDFGMNFGFPPKHAEACMAETIALCLEGRFESFTIGGDISAQKVSEIDQIATKHGFEISGFRRFERAIPDEEVEAIRKAAGR